MNPAEGPRLQERFEVERSLGQGSFGVVYEVFDRAEGRRVALKKLRHLDAATLRRFKREFRACADLSHPNVIRLGELLADGEDCFFTMELVDGMDVLEHVRDRSAAFRSGYDEARLRSAFGQLAEGALCLHSHGIVHRDLKPSNVMVTPQGRVVILDFGLAVTGDGAESVASMELTGTPAYMSPEQGRGEELSPASDWYSVGVMLYEALTGKLPFEGSVYQMLARRLEAEPDPPRKVVSGVPPDLDELCAALLRLDPRDRPEADDVLAWLRPRDRIAAPTPPTPRPAGETFVGRERQLGELRDALALVRGGEPAVALLSGTSGMGKTALARHFLDEVRSDPDALVLTGRCYQRESVPYKAFDALVDAMARHLSELDEAEARALLPEDRAALERLFPVLGTVAPEPWSAGSGAATPNAQELRRRAFGALKQLLARLAQGRSLVLAIDDLQWGDLDSGALLRELMRPPDAPALFLLLSYRSEDGGAASLMASLAQELSGGPVALVEIEVGELTNEEARELARARLGGGSGPDVDRRAEVLARESGGNPFFLDELARFDRAVQDAPGGIRLEAVIEERLGRLPDPARRLFEMIAVAGRPVEVEVANQAAGLDPKDLGTIEVLRSENWVRWVAGQRREVLPFHDRLRETTLSFVPHERLPSYHDRIAAAWEASGVADAETLAEHYLNAGDAELAGRHAHRAGDQALTALAFDRAVRLYRMSLDAWKPERPAERKEIRRKLGQALTNAGRGIEAARVYLAAAQDADEAEALELRRVAAEQLLISGNIDEGLAVVRDVLSAVGLSLPRTPRRALLGVLLRRAQVALRGLRFTPRRASEVSPALLRKIDTCWAVSMGLSMVDIVRGQHFQAINLLLSLRAGEPGRVVRALILEMGFRSTGGSRSHRWTEALRRRVATLVEELDRPYTDGLFAVFSGIAAHLEGDFPLSLEEARRGNRILGDHCTGVTWEQDTAQLYELQALTITGRWSELAERAPAVLENARERGDRYLETYVEARNLFLLHLGRGDVAAARRGQEASVEGWSRQGFQVQHYWDWYARTEIDLYAGQPRDAWARLEARWGAFRRSLIPRAQAVHVEATFLRARAAVALAAHLEEERERRRLLGMAEKDLRRLEREKVAWATAQAALGRACVASARERPDVAATCLRKAIEHLDGVDMRHFAAAARWRLGSLMPGDEGAAHVARASEWIDAQGIADTERTMAMLAPGTWPG